MSVPLYEPSQPTGVPVKLGPLVLYWRRVIGADPDDRSNPLLVRYILLRWRWLGIFVHKLCRSDHERALHDHPWTFFSLVLRGGYLEVTEQVGTYPVAKLWRGVGSLAYRPASWRHRVVIPSGRPAWTFVVVFKRVRVWGFWPLGRFCRWFQYNPDTGICEE